MIVTYTVNGMRGNCDELTSLPHQLQEEMTHLELIVPNQTASVQPLIAGQPVKPCYLEAANAPAKENLFCHVCVYPVMSLTGLPYTLDKCSQLE